MLAVAVVVLVATGTGSLATPVGKMPQDRNPYRLVVNQRPVVGGTDAPKGDFPFAALIRTEVQKGQHAYCGGTIISREWVVTAGHCLLDLSGSESQSTVHKDKIGVYVGGVSADKLKRYGVKDTKVNPALDMRQYLNDIGLIQLDKPLEWSDTVQPARIYAGEIKSNQSVTAIGWGQTSDGEHSRVSGDLEQVAMRTGTHNVCRQLRQGFKDNNGDVICVPTPDGRDTCYGDSGGPLLLPVEPTAERKGEVSSGWALAGLTSYGDTTTHEDHPKCGARNGAGLYTHVAHYLDFITETTKLRRDYITTPQSPAMSSRHEDSDDGSSGSSLEVVAGISSLDGGDRTSGTPRAMSGWLSGQTGWVRGVWILLIAVGWSLPSLM
ncbi:Transmembrane protease serine 12 [Spiromyces aspiralis]|uniref:Transmembrane protease serine 12 n=1 Tax=Spiromyces aspiralis TaxID=68401 RepID=A0ACC1HQY4_9FUNG|nr:Transmembrane protease serine 12 [Spiromyces aspiralis]